ncbi:ATP-binding protein [Brevundimonas sp.]|jgi:signal transduction histidine kinase/ActR/RegA family two-component response regulator|uniref:ATP-binding protein n=1 Tax=Brevundimonas sp. TaxID=1871086 RepID=UPI0037C170A8
MYFLDSVSPILSASGRERLKQIPVRLLLAAIMAWALQAAGMGRWAPIWLIVAIGVQAFEYLAMAPFRTGRAAGRVQVLLALTSTTTMAAAYSGVALVIWATGDAVLATVGALTLAGGLLTNVASGIGSRGLFFVGATPYLVTLALMPLIKVLDGDLDGVIIMILSSLLFAGAILNVYWRVHGARVAELAALSEAEERLEQAQTAMADRAAMAAIVSHELRTPVSAILAGAHVMRTAETPDKTHETADLIIDAGRLMTGMLNDLLDHSKMEAGAMALEARDFELGDFVRDAVRFWGAPAEEKGLVLIAAAPEGELWLRGDPYRMRQIVNNLVSNAIKFTAAGEIRIAMSVEAAGEGRRRLKLTVQDQGSGISDEAMARLFSPFAQGSAEVARTYGGTGLGLTVSRDLARLMGGDLTATSVEGQGAAFTLGLDLPVGEPVETVDGFEIAPPVLTRRLRVLAVDDHEINRRTISLVLQPMDVELSTASDGHLALALLADKTFDVVLMDVNMPGIDGNETTRRLRASGWANATIPVIGFSAGTEAAQVAACHAAGMTDWLAKPLEPKKLYDALQRAMARPEAVAA